jgi:hypothetical protein
VTHPLGLPDLAGSSTNLIYVSHIKTIDSTTTPNATPLTDAPSTSSSDTTDIRVHADHDADLVEQLFREFETDFSLSAIVQVFNQCRSDLAGSPPKAMPELLARLARCRLSALLAEAAG